MDYQSTFVGCVAVCLGASLGYSAWKKLPWVGQFWLTRWANDTFGDTWGPRLGIFCGLAICLAGLMIILGIGSPSRSGQKPPPLGSLCLTVPAETPSDGHLSGVLAIASSSQPISIDTTCPL